MPKADPSSLHGLRPIRGSAGRLRQTFPTEASWIYAHEPCIFPRPAMNALAAAVLLSLVSSLCYAAGAVLQEHIATTTAPSRYGLLRSGRWWVSVALNGSGALLHAVALGLGPLTVVQPLGVLTLVLAAPLAALLAKRAVSAAGWRGIVMVSAGLAALLSLTGSGIGSPQTLSGPGQAVLAVAVAGMLLALVAVGIAARGRRPVRTVALATAAGVAYGAASVYVKTVADSRTTSSLAALLPVLLLIALLATAGLAASQTSYRGGGLATPLATATVVNPAFAAAVGIVLLDEGFRYGWAGTVGALASAAVTAWGLFTLAAGRELRAARTSPAEPPDSDGEPPPLPRRRDEAAGATPDRPSGRLPHRTR